MPYLVSPFILEKYAAGQTAGNLDGACLFVDISGFSSITHSLMRLGQHGAEVLAAIMRAIFDPLIEAVYAYEGLVIGFAGDAFTALFPVQEDEADERPAAYRALAASWAIRQAMLDQSSYETAAGVFNVAAKAGLAVGSSHWQIIVLEEEKRATFYFRGTAVDAAAGAEKDADRNTVLLTPAAHRLLTGDVEAIAAGSHFRVLSVTGELPEAGDVRLPEADPAVVAHFFPKETAASVDSGEFRQVINLFISLQGALTDEQLCHFGRLLLTLQGHYGGLLNRIDLGDKGCHALLFWGAPVSHENDVERALNFLLDLQERCPISLRAGVTYQIAHAGIIGSAQQGEYTCYGDGVNLAARLMTGAPWGALWLNEEMARRARRAFVVSPAGDRSFKGFPEPQPVYRLEERRPVNQQLFSHDMVGRRQELVQLQSFLQPILDPVSPRFAGVLALEGEAGLGKSRLVAALIEKVESGEWGVEDGASGQDLATLHPPPATLHPPHFFICQADPLQNQALQPFRHWLRDYFGQSPLESAARNKRAFSEKLDGLLVGIEEIELADNLSYGRSFLGSLVGLAWAGSPYETAPPEGRREWTVTALKSLILAECRRQPVVLVLEDAHWMDTESVAFVERLLRQVKEVPLAVLAVARPMVGDRPLLGKVAYERLDLSSMTPADLVQVAANVLSGSIDEPLQNLLVERAEGNPFFAEQIVLYLRERGEIELSEDSWRCDDARQDIAVPGDIRTIFTARLDRLTASVREVVQTAAVLGREFEVQVLARLLNQAPELDDLLNAAQGEAIWTPISQMRYLFKHALLRDAAYGMQVRARRRALHRLAAEALLQLAEEQAADKTMLPYGEIAHHYDAAHQLGETAVLEQALDYLALAGEQAARDYENDLAVDFYSRALALLPDEAAEQRYTLLLARETLYNLMGRREEQTRDLEALAKMVEAAADPARQAEITLRHSKMARATADSRQAYHTAQKAVELAQSAGDMGREADGRLQMGLALQNLGEYHTAQQHLEQAEALAKAAGRQDIEAESIMAGALVAVLEHWDEDAMTRAVEEALAIYRAIGDRRGEAGALHKLASWLDDQDEQREASRQALQLYQEIGDRHGECQALGDQYRFATREAQVTEAEELLTLALAIAREIGDLGLEASSLGYFGNLFAKLGFYQTALPYYEQALEIYRRVGSIVGQARVLGSITRSHELLEHYEKAQAYGRETFATLDKLESPPIRATEKAVHIPLLLRLDQQDQIQALLQEAAILLEGVEQKFFRHIVQIYQAYMLLAEGDHGQALALLESWWDWLIDDEWDRRGLDWRSRLFWIAYQVLQHNDDPRAQPLLEKIYQTLQALAARLPEEAQRRSFLENVPWHRQLVAAYERGEAIPLIVPLAEETVTVPLEAAELAPQKVPLKEKTAVDKKKKKRKRKSKKKKGKRDRQRPVVHIHVTIEHVDSLNIFQSGEDNSG